MKRKKKVKRRELRHPIYCFINASVKELQK